LADTHIVIWWLVESKRLSREQLRVVREVVSRGEPIAVSAATLVEIAVLSGFSKAQRAIKPREVLEELDTSSDFQILPITVEVATEIAAVGDSLRDPFVRTIVCTARVHRLRLLTADERIIESRLVPVID
jgi:PIN domain nuclease of toxin-antitoxin system